MAKTTKRRQAKKEGKHICCGQEMALYPRARGIGALPFVRLCHKCGRWFEVAE